MTAVKTILVVDDDIDFRQTLRDALASVGAIVLSAANGLRALNILNSMKVDAIVLDAKMPVMDGFQFLSKRLRDPDLIELPIVLISGRADQLEVGRHSFAVKTLAKPFGMDELFTSLGLERNSP